MLGRGKFLLIICISIFAFSKDNHSDQDIKLKLHLITIYVYNNFNFRDSNSKQKFLLNQKRWKKVAKTDCTIIYEDIGSIKSFNIQYKACLENTEEQRYKYLLTNYICKTTQMSSETCTDKIKFLNFLEKYKQFTAFKNKEILSGTLTQYNNIAYYLQKAGANEEAIYLLEKIIKKFPDRTVAYYNIGDAYWALGEKEKAKKAYTTYIEQMCNKGLQKKIPKEVLKRVERKDVCK